MNKLNLLAIDIGHNVNHDTGAVGIRNEDELNKMVGEALINKCRKAHIRIVNCTPEYADSLNGSLQRRCYIANNKDADFYISIHHNCGGGHGAEALVYKEGLGSKVGNAVLNNLSKIGLINRGVKIRNNLAVLRNTFMPAVLIECAFVDSSNDMNNYDTDKVADCIFEGICEVFEIDTGSNNNSNTDQSMYHIVEEGDTLWGISSKYNVTVSELVMKNGIENPDLINVGQKIKLY